jgi:peroxiredoxin Q/BCP
MGKTTIEVGGAAPELTLLDQDGTAVKLGGFKGSWVVLYFYPKDDTPGCTAEACEFTEGIEAFTEMNAIVLGCSPDSPEEHQKFIAKYGLRVRLLSDPDHQVMEPYGAWGEKNMCGKITVGVIRSTVIIDPDGKIDHRWKRVGAKGHAAKVRECLEKLQS